MSTTAKRKHGHSSRVAGSGSSGGEKRPKGDEEKPHESDSKRQKVENLPPYVPPTRENGGTLGGLPLYGETLPAGGYSGVPAAASETCKKLMDIMRTVKEMKSGGAGNNETGLTVQRKSSVLLFTQLRQLNRLSNLHCKETRDSTQEKKLGIDELHLQLQNLQYEAKHLQKEITSCLEFKSKHEDLDLISVDEFYETAPESLTDPEVTKTDSHKLMLARLEWEKKQREQLASRQSSLEASIKSKLSQTQKLEEKLSRLRPALEQLRVSSLSLEEFFDAPLDWEREQHKLAALLPRPLYMLYVQAEGYSKAEDSLLKVIVNGNIDEAKTFSETLGQGELREETQQEEEVESEHSGSKKKKRRKSSKHLAEDESPPCRVSFPLSVSLKIVAKGIGSVTICFHYLPFFSAVCLSVVSIDLDATHSSMKELFVDKSVFLHNLFEGDSGKTSPNSAVSVQIRKYGGTNFSAAVRQYGFPFKWVQQVCGIIVSSDVGAESNDIKLDNELSASSLVEVINTVRSRMTSQLYLTKQLLSLEQLKIPSPPAAEGEDNDCRLSSFSNLSRWKSLTLSEVQSSQFGGIAIFNLQERANRYFLATFSQGTVRWHCIICVSTEYPRVKPVFAILVELLEKQREPYDMQLKSIEADVNIHYPLTLNSDVSGEKLLTLQIQRLKALLENYVQFRTSSSSLKDMSLCTRGKGRLLSFLN